MGVTRAASLPQLRVAGRLSIAFVVDQAKLSGYGREVLDGLLFMAISQANVAPITRDPELQWTYATLDRPPPDELRRPISINALAASLRIPFETVRRRVGKMVRHGLCVMTPKGVYIPQGPLTSPSYALGAYASYELVRSFYHRLQGIGMFTDLPASQRPAQEMSGDPPVRLVARLSSEYLLRFLEPLPQHIGDLVSCIVLFDVLIANTEHLSDMERGTDAVNAGGFIPDSRRRPVRISALATRLGMRQETIRRHITTLAGKGLCERLDDGYIVPAKVLAHTPFVQVMLDNQSHLNRLYGALAELGVLAEWDRQNPAMLGAA